MNASEPPALHVVQLRPDAVLPQRQHADDAGLDLVSVESVLLPPGGRAVVGTGIAVAVPPGWSGLVCPRSGLAAHGGVTVLNAPGIVDAGYRGELRVVLHNTDRERGVDIQPGDRIAQLLLVQAPVAPVRIVDELPATASNERGLAGFGSTGGVASVDALGARP